MTEENGQRAEPRGPLVGVVITLLVLIALYCVSGVPVVWGFLKLTGDVPEPILKLYAPLDWLYNNNDSVKTTLDAQGKVLGNP